ncbi:hypothetical protein ACTXT7_013150 [Hymenolepis weldensis]
MVRSKSIRLGFSGSRRRRKSRHESERNLYLKKEVKSVICPKCSIPFSAIQSADEELPCLERAGVLQQISYAKRTSTIAVVRKQNWPEQCKFLKFIKHLGSILTPDPQRIRVSYFKKLGNCQNHYQFAISYRYVFTGPSIETHM